MKRVLFVDDSPEYLDELRRALAPYAATWEVDFVVGGEAALRALAVQPADVVVSDQHMPGMDGVEFLQQVRKRWPGAIRMVLSTETDRYVARRLLETAHQFIGRPVTGPALYEIIDRACAITGILADTRVRDLVGSVNQLPVEPQLYLSITRLLNDPDASIRSIASHIQRDPAMVAKVLQVVNSAFFGLARHCASVEQAIHIIGTDTLRSLILTFETFDGVGAQYKNLVLDMKTPRNRGLLAAMIAKQMFPEDRRKAEDAYTAALLHEIGFLILARHTPEDIGLVFFGEGTGRSMYEVEQSQYGVTHADMGAYLLGLWGLPLTVVEGVAYHHRPPRLEPEFDVVAATHIAAVLASECLPIVQGVEYPPTDTALDERLVEALGLGAKVEEWRAFAREAMKDLP